MKCFLLLLCVCSCAGASFEASPISTDGAEPTAEPKPLAWRDASSSVETGASSNDGGGAELDSPSREASPPSFEDAPACVFDGPSYTVFHDTGCAMIVGPKGCEDFIRSASFEGGRFVGATAGKCCAQHFSNDPRMCLEVPGA